MFKLILELNRSSDIILETASEFKNLFCVGFSAESEKIIENAKIKLKKKKLNMIVANSINESMGKDSAEVHLIFKDKVIHIPKKNKNELASDILVNIHKLEAKRSNVHEYIN